MICWLDWNDVATLHDNGKGHEELEESGAWIGDLWTCAEMKLQVNMDMNVASDTAVRSLYEKFELYMFFHLRLQVRVTRTVGQHAVYVIPTGSVNSQLFLHNNMQWQSDKRWTVNSDRQW